MPLSQRGLERVPGWANQVSGKAPASTPGHVQAVPATARDSCPQSICASPGPTSPYCSSWYPGDTSRCLGIRAEAKPPSTDTQQVELRTSPPKATLPVFLFLSLQWDRPCTCPVGTESTWAQCVEESQARGEPAAVLLPSGYT
ncbi:Hypothetical predicted protein, partial [Marmota monax]